MHRQRTLSLGLVALFGIGFSGVAAAADWKQMVTDAGGFWAPKLDAAGWNKIFAPDANRVIGQLPVGVRTMLQTEVKDNPWVTGHEEMLQKLGKFRPEAQQVFDLPYVPIPADKMKFNYESQGIGANMKRHVSYTEGGKKYVRFFFHPLYADKYKELIETYGVKYEYQAISTSSPRSLVVWKKGEANKPIWVKVSLHATIDSYTKRDAQGKEVKVGISRVQSEKKAYRSAFVDSAFASTPKRELDRQQVEYMGEPASFVPGDIQYKGKRVGFDRATIFRELPTALTDPSAQTRWVPAFSFIKNMKPTLDALNAERTAAGKKPLNVVGWMTKGLIEPLVRTYINLGLEHGLQGELHTQNFLLEVNKKGVPTGKIMVKDLDGFRMDLDMRIRNGKDVSFLSNYKHPFEWAKHSATQGSSSSPAVLQGWFNKLIRNVNGFTTTRTVNGQTVNVYSTPAGQLMERLEQDFPQEFAKLKAAAVKRDPTIQGNAEKTKQKAIEQVFDLVGRAQFSRQTGIRIKMEDWGYGQDKGLNNGLGKLRSELFKTQQGVGAMPNANGRIELGNAQAQTVLSRTWNKLRTPTERKKDDRTWTNGTPHSFRLLGDGIIEAISKTGKPVGYAILKPDQAQALATDLRGAGLRPPAERVRAASTLQQYSGKDRSALAPMGSWLNARTRTPARAARR